MVLIKKGPGYNSFSNSNDLQVELSPKRTHKKLNLAEDGENGEGCEDGKNGDNAKRMRDPDLISKQVEYQFIPFKYYQLPLSLP